MSKKNILELIRVCVLCYFRVLTLSVIREIESVRVLHRCNGHKIYFHHPGPYTSININNFIYKKSGVVDFLIKLKNLYEKIYVESKVQNRIFGPYRIFCQLLEEHILLQ